MRPAQVYEHCWPLHFANKQVAIRQLHRTNLCSRKTYVSGSGVNHTSRSMNFWWMSRRSTACSFAWEHILSITVNQNKQHCYSAVSRFLRISSIVISDTLTINLTMNFQYSARESFIIHIIATVLDQYWGKSNLTLTTLEEMSQHMNAMSRSLPSLGVVSKKNEVRKSFFTVLRKLHLKETHWGFRPKGIIHFMIISKETNMFLAWSKANASASGYFRPQNDIFCCLGPWLNFFAQMTSTSIKLSLMIKNLKKEYKTSFLQFHHCPSVHWVVLVKAQGDLRREKFTHVIRTKGHQPHSFKHRPSNKNLHIS